ALVREEGVRLLTLTGPGGIGKTRLAVEIAAELRDDFPDGVAWVPLAEVRDAAAVVPAILAALGIASADVRDPLADLVRALRETRRLLLLDNVEQVVAAAADVAELLASCPGITVLATSRTRLRLRGEHAIPLAPLGFRIPGDSPSMDRSSPSDAVQLFADRAREVDPDFALTPATEPIVEEICRRLDGLPLAIELAAARLNLLAPRTLLARLERRLPLLTGGARDAPARQRTLRDAIAWSHHLLFPEEQTLFRRLAVFAGGFPLEAAEWVTGDGVWVAGAEDPDSTLATRNPEPATLDLLAALVEGHLVLSQPEAPGGPRYTLLETIREYAGEQLAASGEAEAVRRRHAAFFLEVAERHEILPLQPFDDRQLNRLEAERANLRSALAWFEAASDFAGLRRLVAAVGYFWWLGGHLHEGLPWLQRAIAVGDRVADERPDIAPRIAVPYGAIVSAGTPASNEAERVLADALVRCRDVADARGVATVLILLGFVANLRGDFDRAVPLLEEAVSVAGSMADPRQATALSGSALANLGDAVRFQGKLPQAAAHCGEALRLHRAIGYDLGVVHDVVDLGLVARDGADWPEAAERFREGLRLATPSGERRYIVVALEGIATVLAATDRAEAAARLFGAAERMRETTGVTQDFPADQAANERARATVQATLGEPAFAATRAAGRARSLEQAVNEALAEPPPETPTAGAARQGPRPGGGRPGALSPRELDVVRLLAAGRT
ncbi:MAG TPA: NB-ARC domain-containing protein, partial [Thermomicrobiales bacterium]|nr:NB-ARC domain-containing protein [Thermomicrobiales bacterium]